MHPEIEQNFKQRLGESAFTARHSFDTERTFKGRTLPIEYFFRWKRMTHRIMHLGLFCIGQAGRGRTQANNIIVKQNALTLPRLPDGFDGFRILHLSDLHLNKNSETRPILLEKLGGLQYDLCVITGDYIEDSALRRDETLQAFIDEIIPSINVPIYSILGNHDSLEIAAQLEAHGIQFLLNESTAIEHNGATLHLLGFDEIGLGSHPIDVHRVADPIPENAFCIYLTHSPQSFRDAEKIDIDLYLCGHTHAGQACWKSGKPIITKNAWAPLDYCQGAWQHKSFRGYTSYGIGTSSIAARFNCPPEIVIHTLNKGE